MTTDTDADIIAAALKAFSRDPRRNMQARERAAALPAEIARLQAQVDALRHERDRARISTDNAVKLLVSIHSLLYPAPITLADGRTMVFRPESPDPHEVLQELSDRIRALPNELAADWFYASMHADQTMQGIADEYRAAKAACESLNKEKP